MSRPRAAAVVVGFVLPLVLSPTAASAAASTIPHANSAEVAAAQVSAPQTGLPQANAASAVPVKQVAAAQTMPHTSAAQAAASAPARAAVGELGSPQANAAEVGAAQTAAALAVPVKQVAAAQTMPHTSAAQAAAALAAAAQTSAAQASAAPANAARAEAVRVARAGVLGAPQDPAAVYVSQNGNDQTGDGSGANPYQSLTMGFESVADGGTVYVMDDLDLTVEAHVGGVNDSRKITLAKDPAAGAAEVRIVRHNDADDIADFKGNMVSVGAGGGLTLKDGVVIDGNNVPSLNAAVTVYGTFVMEGGRITDNTTSGYGGGLYLQDTGGALFQMKGGSIAGNTASQGGGGVYFLSGRMEIEGAAQIGTSDTDNGVYLSQNALIELTGTLDASARINVENRQGASVGARIATKASSVGALTAQDVAAFHWQTIAYTIVAGTGANVQDAVLAVDQTDFYVAGDGNDTTGTGAIDKPFATLTRVFEELPKGVNVSATVHVKSDITEYASATLREGDVTIKTWDQAAPSPAVISRSTSDDFTQYILNVTNGATLLLDNIVVNGNKMNNSLSALHVENKATAVLNNTTIKDNYTSTQGGGVSVVLGGALQVGDGSRIEGNQATGNGAAVYLYSQPNADLSTMEVSGNVVIGTPSGTEGIYLGADNKVDLKGDLPPGAVICFEGKGAGPTIGDVLVKKTGGETVSTAEALQVYYLYQDASVVADTDANSYVFAAGYQMFYVSAAGSDTTGLGTRGRPFATLAYTFTQVKEGVPAVVGVMTDLIHDQAATLTGDRSVKLMPDVSGDAEIVIQRVAGFAGVMLTVNTQASLTIGDVTLDGNGTVVTNANGVLLVQGTQANQTAEAVLAGGTIRNARSTTSGYSAVRVTASTANAAAKFVMSSGKITGNRALAGGAVYMAASASGAVASFEMDGGELSNNTATNYGGGVYLSGGASGATAIFRMDGGQLSNNTAPNGGGVYTLASTSGSSASFQMLGGAVSGNTATSSGGGVYLSGALAAASFSGGQITGNTAATGKALYQAAATNRITVDGEPQLGTGDADNGVYLVAGASLRVAADLGSQARVNVEQIAGAVVGTLVATKTSGNVTEAEAELFYWMGDPLQRVGALASANTYVVDGLKAVFVDLNGNDLTGDGSRTAPFATLTRAFEVASATAQATVNVMGDLTATANAPLGSPKDVVLRTDPDVGSPATVTRNTSSCLISVGPGASLTVQNLHVDGDKNGSYSANTSSLVCVNGSSATGPARFTLEEGGVLTNNHANYGGSIAAYANVANGSAEVTVADGVISGNTANYSGGGIYGSASSSSATVTVTLNDGEISGNSAASGGGVQGSASVSGAIANLAIVGGAITSNVASEMGGGVSAAASNSGRTNLNISGGEVNLNQVAQIGGGGVAAYATTSGSSVTTMSGGVIANNEVTGTDSTTGGGGVLVYATYSNTSSYGSANFTMNGGQILANEAWKGAGIYLRTANNTYSRATATLTGGTVSQNRLMDVSGRGAAVGFEGTSTSTQQLYLGGSVRLGVDSADNGVYLSGSTHYIYQSSAFSDTEARVNIEGKVDATYNTQVVARSGTATTTDQSAQYLWQPGNGLSVTASGTAQYILTGAPQLYVSKDGDDVNGLGNRARPFETISRAFTAAAAVSGVTSTVYVMDEVPAVTTATVTASKAIRLAADPEASDQGAVRVVRAANNIVLLQVNAGGTLTLVDVTVDGQKDVYPDNTAPLVYALGANNNATAQFTMTGGALVNNHATSGGAISVYAPGYSSTNSSYSSRASAYISGGTIQGNSAVTGGALSIRGYQRIAYAQATVAGSAVMNGNEATEAGGAVYVYGRPYTTTAGSNTYFYQTGGTISGNTAPNGAGVYLTTDTDAAAYAAAYITGGTITGNTLSGSGGHGAAVGFQGDYPATQLLYVGSNARIGTDANDNGIWLPANYTIKQSSNLGDDATIVVEGKDGADAGTVIVDKTTSTAVSAAEAAKYIWAPSTQNSVAPATTGQQYVLTGSSTLYVSSQGNDSTGDGSRAKPLLTLTKAFGLATLSTPAVVYVMDAMEAPSTAVVTSRKSITVRADPQSSDPAPRITRAVGTAGNLVRVESGGSLTWYDAILDGDKASGTASSAALVYVFNTTASTTAAFTLVSGVLTNNQGTNGGAIYATSSAATARTVVTVNGGEITDNNAANGAGVFVTGAGAALTVTGGTISGNTASSNGGGIYLVSATLTISGAVQVGTGDADNGVYLGAGVVIGQSGDLPVEARINVEGRADLATNALIATKTGGTVSDEEAARYHWQGGTQTIITSGTSQYVVQRPTGSIYVAASGSDQTGDGSQTNPFASLAHAFAFAPTGTVEVFLMSDVDAVAAALVTSSKNITLAPYPAEAEFKVLRGGVGFALLEVAGGGSLVVSGLVFDGRKDVYAGNSESLVRVVNADSSSAAV
ncbi:MAG: hypothetical protein LBE08_04265, partial [Bifidobacteriaceae bacterium]|nr:hypothetical protein [Bifidobacteriaceae bacterium]